MVLGWQEQQWQQLAQARGQDRLHHAILLVGQRGLGKHQFAMRLAHALLCQTPDDSGDACGHCSACRLLAADTHPDLSVLSPLPPKDSKSQDPVLSIRIDAIRDLGEKLSTTASMGGRRVAVITDAEKMRHEAANSLLKTLEEPGSGTHIILTSSQPHRLPITIRSRCQQLVFPVPADSDVIAWLQQQGVADPEQTLRQHHGAPLAAANDEQAEERQLMADALLARARHKPSLAYSDAMSKLPRQRLLSLMQDWLADLIRTKAGCHEHVANIAHRKELGSIAQTADWKRLYRLQDELCRLSRVDGIALNGQLFWENLLISWDRL